jgi:hypothetical protein
MHNTIQELRGNIRVFARVRPFLPGDNVNDNAEPSIRAMSDVALEIVSLQIFSCLTYSVYITIISNTSLSIILRTIVSISQNETKMKEHHSLSIVSLLLRLDRIQFLLKSMNLCNLHLMAIMYVSFLMDKPVVVRHIQ